MPLRLFVRILKITIYVTKHPQRDIVTIAKLHIVDRHKAVRYAAL